MTSTDTAARKKERMVVAYMVTAGYESWIKPLGKRKIPKDPIWPMGRVSRSDLAEKTVIAFLTIDGRIVQCDWGGGPHPEPMIPCPHGLVKESDLT